MEIIVERIDIEENGRILVYFNDGLCLDFSSIQVLQEYVQAVLNTDAIKRIVLATMLVNNNIVPTTNAKKYTLTMLGEPVLKIQDT